MSKLYRNRRVGGDFRNCTNLIAHVFTVQTAADRIKSGTAQSIPTIFCFASGGFCVEICSHRLWALPPTSSAPPPEECEPAYSWQDRPYQDQAGCRVGSTPSSPNSLPGQMSSLPWGLEALEQPARERNASSAASIREIFSLGKPHFLQDAPSIPEGR